MTIKRTFQVGDAKRGVLILGAVILGALVLGALAYFVPR